jgi:hypothetical protein
VAGLKADEFFLRFNTRSDCKETMEATTVITAVVVLRAVVHDASLLPGGLFDISENWNKQA